jgi:hypothetical protein
MTEQRPPYALHPSMHNRASQTHGREGSVMTASLSRCVRGNLHMTQRPQRLLSGCLASAVIGYCGAAPLKSSSGAARSTNLCPPFDAASISMHSSNTRRSGRAHSCHAQVWIWRGKRPSDSHLLDAYTAAMRALRKRLLGGSPGGMRWVGEVLNSNDPGPPASKLEHLTCFLPGLLALGHIHGVETGTLR